MAEEESFVILGSCSQTNSLHSMDDAKNENEAYADQKQNGELLKESATELPILIDSQFGSIRKAIASATKPSSTPEQSTSIDVWKKSDASDNALVSSTDSVCSIGRDVWKKSVIANDTNSLQQDDMGIIKEQPKPNTGAIPKTNTKDAKNEIQTKVTNTAENPLAVSFIPKTNTEDAKNEIPTKVTNTAENPLAVSFIPKTNTKDAKNEIQTKVTNTAENPLAVSFIPKTNTEDAKNEIPTKVTNTAENPLAVSFIMGQVPADTLKANIHSQFPSVSLKDCEELTTVMSDYLKMKDLIIQVNHKMNTWLEKKSAMHAVELENRQKLQECQEQIADLRNENMKLKLELETKVEQLRAQLTEKTALIENMREKIEKLEAQQLASSEIAAKTNKEDKKSEDKSEYVTRVEHEHIVKNFESNMAQLLAEKLQVSDIQKQYIDEINCLKSNLKSSEDLVYQLQTDISVLQSTDAERTAQFVIYTTQRDQMSEEIGILRQQVDVYNRDFQLERTAREEMAGEKAQLLDDLRALQRVNLRLTEQVANHEERLASLSSTQQQQQQQQLSSPPERVEGNNTPTAPPAAAHTCPICSITCSSLTTLQEHVNQCLDMNVHT